MSEAKIVGDWGLPAIRDEDRLSGKTGAIPSVPKDVTIEPNHDPSRGPTRNQILEQIAKLKKGVAAGL
jgi:hypothetical protein